MLHLTTANKIIKTILALSITAILMAIFFKLSLRPDADDQYFLAAINNQSLSDYITHRYMTWSGRVTLEAVMVLTIGHEWFWRLSIPLTLLLLACSISRISTGKVSIQGAFLSIILLMCIPLSINTDTVWWVTGYYNYLLPTAMAAYALSIMMDENRKKVEVFLSFACAIFFSYAEQTSVVFLISAAIIFAANKKNRNSYFISIILFCAVNFIILMKAPGNYERLNLETWRWMPEFSEYSFVHKMALGFEKVHQSFVIKYNIPVIAMALLLASSYIRNGIKSASGNISAFISIVFVCFSVVASKKGFAFSENFFSDVFITSDKWCFLDTYLSYFFIMTFISSVATLIISLNLNESNKLISVMSFLIGCISVFMVGFSPTVYASSLRVDYVFEVCCIISLMSAMNIKKAP